MDATQAASSGSQVVSKAAEAMRQIQQSSNRVSEIIGFIDRIAFQTNILALNAAVEAARAGDHCKGFNVVAGEVRALAQQAAVAAKEIRALIDGALVNVVEGAEEVGSAGAAMDRIVLSAQKVASIMSEIAEASLEQSAGIEQVGGIIVQLDTSYPAERGSGGRCFYSRTIHAGSGYGLGTGSGQVPAWRRGRSPVPERFRQCWAKGSRQGPAPKTLPRRPGNVVSLNGRTRSPSKEH